MRGKVTLEVVWRETVCEEALQGMERTGGGRVQPVLLLGAATSTSSSSGGGYTTVPLGELAGLF